MQFMFGVGGYIIARVLAILLPLFFVNQPGQEDLAIRIVLILENIVLWGFLGALAYIFRSAPFSLTSSHSSLGSSGLLLQHARLTTLCSEHMQPEAVTHLGR